MVPWKALSTHLILTLGALFMGLPVVLLLISTTYQGGLSASSANLFVPGNALDENIENMHRILAGNASIPTLYDMLFTSFKAGASIAIFTTAFSFMAAYALVFMRPKGSDFLFGLTLVTLYFPIEARMLATFDVAARLGLINTHLGLVLPVMPFALATFVFVQHMKSFPKEYLEAARLDGTKPIRFLIDFAIPLSVIPISALACLIFIFGWNQYLWPLIISLDNSQFTLMRGISLLRSGSGPSLVLAVISFLPPGVLFFLFQRKLSTLTNLRG